MNAFIIAWIVSVLGSGSSVVAKLNNEQIETAKVIYYHAQEYGINPDKFLSLAVCESGLNKSALGDNGKAKNVFQFHAKTFKRYSELYNAPLDRDNAVDQIFLAANIISDGGIDNWYACKNKIKFSSAVKLSPLVVP